MDVNVVEPRWFYVGNGQLRLKQGEDWTDQFETIESPRARATAPGAGAAEPVVPPTAKASSHLMAWLILCVLLVVAGGAGAAYATGTLKRGALTSLLSGTPAAPAGAPAHAAKVYGGGFTKADYTKRIGAIPVWVADVRRDSGHDLATHVDLLGLGLQLDAVGKLPPPPKVDPTWWAANNSAMSKLGQQAAARWASGKRTAALSSFEAAVKRSNAMTTKVNAAFGLHVALSRTAG